MSHRQNSTLRWVIRAAAFKVDEVKDIRDKARAIEVYARQLGLKRLRERLVECLRRSAGREPWGADQLVEEPTAKLEGCCDVN